MLGTVWKAVCSSEMRRKQPQHFSGLCGDSEWLQTSTPPLESLQCAGPQCVEGSLVLSFKDAVGRGNDRQVCHL